MNVWVNGGKLRQTREGKLIQREELVELSGVSMSGLVRIELSDGPARVSTVKKLAGALGVDPDDFVTGKAESLGGRPSAKAAS